MAKANQYVHDVSKSLIQTRVPEAMRACLKKYGKHHGLKMEALLVRVLQHFLRLRPDQRGVTWRTPQSHRTEQGVDGGWVQINVLIPNDVAGQLASLSMQLGASRATIAYTALYWFGRYMRPPLNPDQQKRSNAVNSANSNASGAPHA